MQSARWTTVSLSLALACFLPACNPGSLGGGSLFGATSGSFEFDFCPDPVDCEAAEYGLFANNGRLALEVGDSLVARVSIELVCPDLCSEEVASVEWQASWPDVVSLTPEGTLAVRVTGVAPGEVALTAEVTLRSGVSRSVDVFLDSPGLPLVVTVVPVSS